MTTDREPCEIITGAPPDGWEDGELSILRNNGLRSTIEAWLRGAFAIHRDKGGNWRLSHVPTGLQIYTVSSVGAAAALADKIEPLTDWSAIKKAFPLGSELYPKVKLAVDEVEKGHPAHDQR